VGFLLPTLAPGAQPLDPAQEPAAAPPGAGGDGGGGR